MLGVKPLWSLNSWMNVDSGFSAEHVVALLLINNSLVFCKHSISSQQGFSEYISKACS